MIRKDKSRILKDMMARKRSSPPKYVAIESVFYKKERQNLFKVFKKSIAVRVSSRDFLLDAKKVLKKKADRMGLAYAGMSDVFNIGGKPEHEVFLGRTAYYDLNSKTKAKELIGDLSYLNFKSEISIFFVSLVFFIKDKPSKDSFSIVYNIGIKSSGKKLNAKIFKIASSNKIKRSICLSSLDISDARSIYFIGIRWIEEIGQTGLFDSTESIFKTKKAILNEIEPIANLRKKIAGMKQNNKELLSRE
jgi:hypothetical protein